MDGSRSGVGSYKVSPGCFHVPQTGKNAENDGTSQKTQEPTSVKELLLAKFVAIWAPKMTATGYKNLTTTTKKPE